MTFPPEPTCPTCPACGGTPASMIEDGYSTDLVPWWRHYAQKFNPFRLVRPKPKTEWIRWISLSEEREKWDEFWAEPKATSRCLILSNDPVRGRLVGLVESEDKPFLHHFCWATHFCPVPDLPVLPPLP